MNRRNVGGIIVEAAAVLSALIVFGIPFLFVILNAGKTVPEAAQMSMAVPAQPRYLSNFIAVFTAQDWMLVRAFWNSAVITAFSIAVLIVVSALTGFVMERNKGRAVPFINFLVMAGLMIPPSVVTTIWILKGIGLYRTLAGLVFVEVALGVPFSALLYRGFMVSIPREIDEATVLEGAGGFTLFTKIIFPLLKPVTSTVAIISAVNIFNDFVNPLYFLPGSKNVTIQLTLYNFMTMYVTQWNLLFANVLLISLPPLVFFIFLNRKIIAGMVAGAIKG